MIRDFSNSAKKKLLEYVKDATETTLWRKIAVSYTHLRAHET